jgi:hypothetical protein
MPKPKNDIQERVEVVLRHSEKENRKTEMRIVNWLINGKDTGPKLEKRDFFMKDGVPKTGRCVGFNREDVKFIHENWNDILVFFR